ncbi:MAG: RNA 2',3'-cyclic phosphodiesterase [Planctomycetes bacterium]|nr:RNA 2',3'-cyclic phosphodiesterase [Planctomycetota bacterium]
MKRVRSFIAIHLDEATRAALERAQRKLEACGAKVRWVRPQALHLTLKFLGDIDAERVSDVAAVIEDVVKGVGPFRLDVRGLGGLPRLERPRVVYAGAADEEGALVPMAEALNNRMAEFGVKRESRKYKAHITLGRVKSPRGIEPLIGMIQQRADEEYGSVEVGSLYLMMSELKPSGAEYTVLHEAKLQEKTGE